jgi:hypothetical protein
MPLFGHHMRNRGGSAATSQSYWVMLLRRDAPGPEIDMKQLGRDNKRKRTTHTPNDIENSMECMKMFREFNKQSTILRQEIELVPKEATVPWVGGRCKT